MTSPRNRQRHLHSPWFRGSAAQEADTLSLDVRKGRERARERERARARVCVSVCVRASEPNGEMESLLG
jgi:hypothetical protein